MPQSFCTGSCILVRNGHSQKIGSELGNGIIRLGRVQIIGCKGRIKNTRPEEKSHFIHTMHGTFAVMENQLFFSQRNSSHLHIHRCQRKNACFPCNAKTSILCGIHCTAVDSFRNGICFGQRCHLLLCLRCFFRSTAQAIFVNQADKFQFLKKFIQRRPVIGLNHRIHRFKVNGCLRTDRCQLIGQICIFLICQQLFPKLGTNGFVLNIFIDTVQTAESQQ